VKEIHTCEAPFAGLHNLRPARTFAIAENVATARIRICNQLPFQIFFQTTTTWNRFCGLRPIYVGQFRPSTFLSCASLIFCVQTT